MDVYSKVPDYIDVELLKKLNKIGVVFGDSEKLKLVLYIPTGGWIPLFRAKFRQLIAIYKRHTGEILTIDPVAMNMENRILFDSFEVVFVGCKTAKQVFDRWSYHDTYYLYKGKVHEMEMLTSFSTDRIKSLGYPSFFLPCHMSAREMKDHWEEVMEHQERSPRRLSYYLSQIWIHKRQKRYDEVVMVIDDRFEGSGTYLIGSDSHCKYSSCFYLELDVVQEKVLLSLFQSNYIDSVKNVPKQPGKRYYLCTLEGRVLTVRDSIPGANVPRLF